MFSRKYKRESIRPNSTLQPPPSHPFAVRSLIEKESSSPFTLILGGAIYTHYIPSGILARRRKKLDKKKSYIHTQLHMCIGCGGVCLCVCCVCICVCVCSNSLFACINSIQSILSPPPPFSVWSDVN